MRALAPALLGASLIATTAQAQGADGQWHDCITSKRHATYAIEATADGAPLRLGADAAHALALRGWRFDITGPIELSCVGVADRLRHCVSAYLPHGSFVRCIPDATGTARRCFHVQRAAPGGRPSALALNLVADVLAAMPGARLTKPAGVWPIDLKVWSLVSDPGDPTPVPCGQGT